MAPTYFYSLILASVRPGTAHEYRNALKLFLKSCDEAGNQLNESSQLDDFLVEYFHHLYYLGDPLQHKSLAGKTLSTVKFFLPDVSSTLLLSAGPSTAGTGSLPASSLLCVHKNWLSEFLISYSEKGNSKWLPLYCSPTNVT